MSKGKKILLLIGATMIMSLTTACAGGETAPDQAESTEGKEDGYAEGSADAAEDADAGSERTDAAEETGKETDTESAPENDRPDLSGRANADTGEGEAKILEEGDIAPDFTARLSGGDSFKLSDHDDKTVIINFWASWCGPCVGEMPAFEMLKDDNLEDLEIICINCMEDEETVDRFVGETGYTFNIGYDVDGAIEYYYPTEGIPYTLVVKKGVISNIFVGALDAEHQYQEYKNAISQ